jgi:hypothetical protein
MPRPFARIDTQTRERPNRLGGEDRRTEPLRRGYLRARLGSISRPSGGWKRTGIAPLPFSLVRAWTSRSGRRTVKLSMPKPVRPFHGPLGSIAYRSKGTARRDARYARCFPRSLAKPRANWSCRRATANAGRQRDRRLDAQPLRSAETRQICPFSRLPRGIVAHGGRGFLNNAPRRPATDRPQRVQSREIRTGVGWPGANQHPSFSTGYRWRLGEFPAARIGKSTGFGRKCQIQLLERLYRPFPVDRRGEVPEGKGPFY